jgi:Substrate binding domain of ABC-type glycine betaine transport system
LQAKGVESLTKLGIGSREIYIRALQDESIAAVPEYTGNLLLNFDANATATTAEEVEKSLPAVLPPDLKVLKSSAAVEQDVYVVTKEFSAQQAITSLDDLKKIASTSTLGGPPELAQRAYGPPGLEKIYGAKFQADHSIKAVEAVLIPLVVPGQDGAHIGHVIGQLDRQGQHWHTILKFNQPTPPVNPPFNSVQALVGMLRLLYPNLDRHAGPDHRTPTLEEARAVVQLAVAIVQWGRDGQIVRK